ARRPQALVGVRRRHADVDERDGRAVRAHLQHQLLGRPRLADDLETGPLAEEDRVVCEHDAHTPVYSRMPDGPFAPGAHVRSCGEIATPRHTAVEPGAGDP